MVYDTHCARQSLRVTGKPSAIRKLAFSLIHLQQNLIYSRSDAPSGVCKLDESRTMSKAAEAAKTNREDTMLYSKLKYRLTPDQ